MEESRAKQIVNEIRDELLGSQVNAGQEGKQVFEELQNLNPNTELDCKEFGEHVRNGGWRLGLLVARNVELNSGSGARTDLGSNLAENSARLKIGTRAFARQAGNITDKTVAKYLNAWNLAASQGHVLDSNSLEPGQEFKFNDELHTPKLWDTFFKPPGGEDDKNQFIALNTKVETFISSLDIDAALADYGDQYDVSLEALRANFARLREVCADHERRLINHAKKINYKINKPNG